jgi:acyl carrier protein
MEDLKMENLKEDLRHFILTEFLPGEKPENLRDDTPLLTAGILNSNATLMVVMFVEEKYGIQVEAHETSPVNFDSIDKIAHFVQCKRA